MAEPAGVPEPGALPAAGDSHSAGQVALDDRPGGRAEEWSADGPDPGQRGSLTITGRAIEKLAVAAAAEVTGVAGSDSGVGRLLGRGLPRASAEVSGQRIHLDADVAARWPSPLGAVAGETRDHVQARVAELTGMTVDRVDVNVPTTVRTGGATRRRASQEPVRPAPARAPSGPAAAVAVGVVLSLALVALGVVAVRDALIAADALHSGRLLPRAGAFLAGARPSSTELLLAILAIVVGLVFLALALRPRSRPGLQLSASIPVYLDGPDVARLAAAAADRVDGVMKSTARATSRKVSVRVQVTGEDQSIADAVDREVGEHLAAVQSRGRGGIPQVATTMTRN